MHLPTTLLLTGGLCWAALACGAADGSTAWTTTRQTSEDGVVRVTHAPPAAGLEPTWIIEEELRIGRVEGTGPDAFALIKGLAVTEDGRIAVLDAQAQEVRVFEPDGRHLATFGGKGGGPGELQGAWGLMRDSEDRLWVPDHRNSRMSVYDAESGFVTSHPMTVLSYGYVWRGAMLEGDRILEPSMTLQPERRSLLRIYGPDMVQLDSILPPTAPAPVDRKNPPGSFYWEAPGGLPRGYMSIPFHPRGMAVYDREGSVWFTPGGDAGYRIIRGTLAGDTTLVIETARPPVPVGDPVRDSAIESVRASLEEQGATGGQDWSRVPRVRPAVEDLFVAEDGPLWVRTATTASLLTFDVYERDGAYAGTAVTSLPLDRNVHPIIRDGQLWAVVRDELDVAFVVRARIREITSER